MVATSTFSSLVYCGWWWGIVGLLEARLYAMRKAQRLLSLSFLSLQWSRLQWKKRASPASISTSTKGSTYIRELKLVKVVHKLTLQILSTTGIPFLSVQLSQCLHPSVRQPACVQSFHIYGSPLSPIKVSGEKVHLKFIFCAMTSWLCVCIGLLWGIHFPDLFCQ